MTPAPPMTCPACRAETTAGERFCASCGRALASAPATPLASPAPPAPSAAPARPCPHCGAPNPARARGCLLCGRALERPTGALSRPLHPGRMLGGRYTVQHMLSKGGMGALYLALDQEDGRTVVVKALGDYFDPADERQARAARERLARESETLAALSHPAIPRTLGAFQDGHHIYLVMEHIAGPNLERGLTHTDDSGATVPGQPYPQPAVLRWGVALCRVLEYLTARPEPLVHHDIKPANVLVSPAGDRVFLVDFGTAQVRLDPQGDVGLEQPSLYGTVGYAPPEQYRGQSEPRSDVYALAATLYHLATDDDPAAHPFSFPLLGTLGPLGKALRDALDQDVRRRPQAHELRRRLEQLLGPALRAPDGQPIPDRAALIAWCLREWHRAAAWLYADLPDQLELWWGDAQAAWALRDIVDEQPDPDLGLDAALAALDPDGIGRERPHLAADAAAVDFGALPGSLLRRDVTIENTGRRFVRLYIFLPRWVRGSSQALALPPGGRTTLALAPDLDRLYLGGWLRGEVLVRDHYGRRRRDTPLLRILLRAFVARRYILSRRYGLPLGGAGVALLLWAGAGFPLPQSRDASPLEARIPDVPAALEGGGAELSYRQARSHYERGAYQAARDQLALHLAQYGETPEVRALLNEVLYHLGNDALARGEWLVARRTFAELLAVAPGYRSADTLLSEAYYRAARAALERGDLAGAREELEALLARQGTYADAGALLVEAIERQARAAVEHSQLDAAAEAVLALRALDPASEALRRLLAAYPALATRAIAYDQATWERGRAWRVATLPREVHGERAALSADGTLLALWSAGQPLRIHRVMGAQLLRTLPAEAGLALDAAFSPDGRTLASVAPDGAVRLWRVGDGSLLRELTGRTAPSALAFSPDGRYLAATGGDAVSIWRADSGRLEQELAVPGAALVSPSYSRDGQFLAAGDRGRVYVWRVRDGTIVGVADAGGGTVQRLALLTEDDLLAVTAGRAVRIDAARGVILSDYSHSSGAAAQGPVTAVAPSNPQGRVAVFEGGGVAEIVPAGGEVAGLALSRDGRVLAVVMRDGSVSVWRPAP